MGPARTVVAVHAHPDDETVTMGGTLARFSAEGSRTVVVTCTTGDLATIFDATLVGEDVASLRARELDCAAKELAVSRVVDVREYVAQKLRAVACHASQFPPTHFLRRMPLDLAQRLWATEFYSRAR